MKRTLIDDSLWFIHKDGCRFYPWFRYSKQHRLRSFWVSDGSNLIRDATPVATVAELVTEVFSRGRSVWLFDGASVAVCTATDVMRFRAGEPRMKSWLWRSGRERLP